MFGVGISFFAIVGGTLDMFLLLLLLTWDYFCLFVFLSNCCRSKCCSARLFPTAKVNLKSRS